MITTYPLPKVIHEQMHTEHIKEMALFNKIEQLLKTEAPEDMLAAMLEEYFVHTYEHSRHEEELMREVGYPATGIKPSICKC